MGSWYYHHHFWNWPDVFIENGENEPSVSVTVKNPRARPDLRSRVLAVWFLLQTVKIRIIERQSDGKNCSRGSQSFNISNKMWCPRQDLNLLTGYSHHFPRLPLVVYSLPTNIHALAMFSSTICAFVGSGGKKSVCKSCARKTDVQTLCKSKSHRNLCKLCARISSPLGRRRSHFARNQPNARHSSFEAHGEPFQALTRRLTQHPQQTAKEN